MARPKDSKKREVENYTHADKERANNPPVGLVTPETDKDAGKKTYAHDPHLDPHLVWAGKAEHTSFKVPTVSLHVHERIDPRTIVETVRKRNGADQQRSLFSSPEENPPIRQAIEFYKHRHNWTNQLIAGDSLLVMNSLLEKEGLGGQVQMVYIDPPYGIRYGSNFQPFVNKRDVTDGKDEDLTGEPEQIRAFRDTWELGIHSYLAYLRDRLLLGRELLHESGSCFVQIGDENVHRVSVVMDEIFGAENRMATISYATTGGSSTNTLPQVADYLLWYVKDRQLYEPLTRAEIIEFSVGMRWWNFQMVIVANRHRRNASTLTGICQLEPESIAACRFLREVYPRQADPNPMSITVVCFVARMLSSGACQRREWTTLQSRVGWRRWTDKPR